MTSTRAGTLSSFSARVRRPRLRRGARGASRARDAPDRAPRTSRSRTCGSATGPFLRRAEARRSLSTAARAGPHAAQLPRERGARSPRRRCTAAGNRVEPWIEIRCHGHTLGHYLTAAACMFESTGDARFAERVDYIVARARGVPGEDRRLAHGVSRRRRAAHRQPRGQALRRRALVHHAQGAGRAARCAPASRQQAGARRAA